MRGKLILSVESLIAVLVVFIELAYKLRHWYGSLLVLGNKSELYGYSAANAIRFYNHLFVVHSHAHALKNIFTAILCTVDSMIVKQQSDDFQGCQRAKS